MAEQWLSIVEYARTFAVSDMTVRRRIKTGKLLAVLRDGKYYIPLAGAERVVEETSLSELNERNFGASLPLPKNAAAEPAFLAVNAPAPLSYAAMPSGFAAPPQIEESFNSDSSQTRPGASFRTLPNQLVSTLQKHEQTLVDSQSLLQFCEQGLTRINSIERHLQESYQMRLQNIETQLKLKDGIIAQLKQQVEDLQILIRLMEQSPRALMAEAKASR